MAKKKAKAAHIISEEGKERIAAAQRKRWKKFRADQRKKGAGA